MSNHFLRPRRIRWMVAAAAATLVAGLAVAGATPALGRTTEKIAVIDASLDAYDNWQRGPTVDYVDRGRWISPTGTVTPLKIDGPRREYDGEFRRFGDGLVANMSFNSADSSAIDVYRHPGDSPERLDLPPEDTFVYPGKRDSIVWMAEKKMDRLTVGQLRQSGRNPDEQTIDGANFGNVVSRNHLWMQGDDSLQRRPLKQLDHVTTLARWSDVMAGDPDRDQVFLVNEKGCADLVKASSLKVQWTTCKWQPVQFSPGGRYVLASKGAMRIEERSLTRVRESLS